jgi:transposase
MSGAVNDRRPVEGLTIMRALDPEVFGAVWAAIEPLVPLLVDGHPLGCHRPRSSNRDCFEVMLVRLSTGCSWEDAERLCGSKVSDTTVRQRRDEWLAGGVFDAIPTEATRAYDRVVGLDLQDVAVDGSLHKSPCGGEGTGKNPRSARSRRRVPAHGQAHRLAKPLVTGPVVYPLSL